MVIRWVNYQNNIFNYLINNNTLEQKRRNCLNIYDMSLRDFFTKLVEILVRKYVTTSFQVTNNVFIDYDTEPIW